MSIDPSPWGAARPVNARAAHTVAEVATIPAPCSRRAAHLRHRVGNERAKEGTHKAGFIGPPARSLPRPPVSEARGRPSSRLHRPFHFHGRGGAERLGLWEAGSA